MTNLLPASLGVTTSPETIHVITVEVAAVVAVASFILGFICNLLVMRRFFVSAEACRDRIRMCVDKRVGELSYVHNELIEIKEEIQSSRNFMIRNYGILKELSAKLRIMESDHNHDSPCGA